MHSVTDTADVEGMAFPGAFWTGLELVGWCQRSAGRPEEWHVSFELPYHTRYPLPRHHQAFATIVIQPPHAVFFRHTSQDADMPPASSSDRNSRGIVVFDRDHRGKAGNADLFSSRIELSDVLAFSSASNAIHIEVPIGPLHYAAVIYLLTLVVYGASSLCLVWLLLKYRPRRSYCSSTVP